MRPSSPIASRERLRDSRAALVVAALVPVLSACPVPLARTEATSSPVVGRLVHEDGRPIADAEMAVATEGDIEQCGKLAERTRTDSSGAFSLRGTQERYGTTWIVPNLDRVAPRFALCASVAGAMRAAYTGIGSLGAEARPDTVECIAWTWKALPRVTCTGLARRAVVTGGRWTDAGGAAGFYRLLLTEEPTQVKGYDKDKPQDRPYVYVQWLEPRRQGDPADAPPWRVRATASLPFDRSKVWAVSEVQLWQRGTRWVASLHGRKHAFMNDMARTELVFELDAPGVARHLAGP